MSVEATILRALLRKSASFILLLTFAFSAIAQSDATDLESRAVHVAIAIKDAVLKPAIIVEEKDTALRLAILRSEFVEEHDLSESTKDLKMIATKYSLLSQEAGTQRDREITNVYNILSQDNAIKLSEKELSDIKLKIRPYLNSSDWFVSHHTRVLWAKYDPFLKDPNLTLASAKKTLNLIPQKNDPYVLEAKFYSQHDIAYLHTSLKNSELAISATEQILEIHQSTQLPIEGHTLINNLLFSISTSRETEPLIELGSLLLDMEKDLDESEYIAGLTSMRMSAIYNQSADFEQALDYAEQSIDAASMEPILQAARLNQIIALAGKGETERADRMLKDFIKNEPRSADLIYARGQAYAGGLIALKNENHTKAIELFNDRLDLEMKHLLSKNNSNTSKLIAELQDTNDRRSERETALKREAELKAEALEQEQAKNGMLGLALLLLSLTLLGLLLHFRYRSKTNKELAAAQERALAGEQAKARFLAVASHELRTPLNGVIGLSELLSRTAPTEELREQNGIVLQCGHDLMMTVENMLDMTIIRADGIKVYPEVSQISRMVNYLETKWRPMIERKDITFTVFLDDKIPGFLFMDAKRTRQCLETLISNASKFTNKGRIHVHITSEPIDAEAHEHELRMIVADTGVGMSPEQTDKMFEAFVQADNSMTREFGGSGLGLAVTKYLIEEMGGNIKVTSRLGKGSEFLITMPVKASQIIKQTVPTPNAGSKDRQAAKIISTQNVNAAILNRKNVLIIEDDPANQKVLKTFLEPEGCVLTCLPNGKDAIQTLSHKHFDLVLMDIRMALVDGIETTKNIRNSGQGFRDIPIIAITADPAPETRAQCMVAGADLFLTKPVKARELFDAIRFVMNKPKIQERKASA